MARLADSTEAAVPARVGDPDLIARRRSDLVQAAVELFLEKGFHKTSMRDIAAAAGWQIGTIYLYISCKEDLLYLITESIMDEVWEGVRLESPSESAAADLRTVAIRMFLTADRIRRKLRLIYRETASLLPAQEERIRERESELRQYLVALVQRGIDSGEFRAVNAEIVAHDLIALNAGWALKHWYLRTITTVEEYANDATELLLGSLVREPAR